MAPSNDQLPLDVNYAKLAEWLTSRQKLPKDWHRKLQAILLKAGEAAQSLPARSKSDDKSNAVDYLLAKHTRETLAETSERNLFGALTGPASVWDKIVRAYDKDNIFLGECSLTLARNVDYEIPFYKRQKGKYQQQLLDLERKQTEYLHSAALAARTYQQECEAFGIQGVKIRSELRSLVEELPGIFLGVAQTLQEDAVGEAMQHYAQFLTSTSVSPATAVAEDLLPTLTKVCKADLAAEMAASQAQKDCVRKIAPCGNEQCGAAALTSSPETTSESLALSREGKAAGQEVNGDAPDKGPEQISWDIDLPAVEDATPEDAASGGAIDWDIDLAEIAQAGEDEQHIPGHANEDSTGHPSAQRDAHAGGMVHRLVNDGEMRGCLLDELHELTAFLHSRVTELTSSSSTFIADTPDALQDVSAGKVNTWLQTLENAMAQMTSPRTGQLLLYKTSERYLDRVTAQLQQKAGQEKKFRRMAQEVEGRRQAVQGNLSDDACKLAIVVQKTMDTKTLVEQALTSQYSRPVLVVGEINNALD